MVSEDDHISKLAAAYDSDVDDFRSGVDLESKIPDSIKESDAYRDIWQNGGGNSGSPEVKSYLNPKAGMNFLDVGSCANLFSYDLDKWESTYYGVDISPKLVAAMKKVAERRGAEIGGLYVADMAELPFEDGFFDMAASIGVLEYFELNYVQEALTDLRRVVKDGARVIVDMPNLDHPNVDTMFEVEKARGRTYADNLPTKEQFREVLSGLFSIVRVEDSGAMSMYFLEAS